MPTTADYLVVGTGLTGSTIARLLADNNREVLLLERRHCAGGNVCDAMHSSQIRFHLYGPHYFRCSSAAIWHFVNRFASFYPYKVVIKAIVDGQYQQWPLTRAVLKEYGDLKRLLGGGTPANFEEACLRKMPRAVYEAYVEGYTTRQWGMAPRLLSPRLARRIHINGAGQTTLTPQHAFQGLPVEGYTQLMMNMTAGIPCLLGVDFLQQRSEFRARKALVFTGPIDEFFQFDTGRLGYRAQRRVHKYLPDCEQLQPCGQVNHCNGRDRGPLRTLEWKHLMPPGSTPPAKGTLITHEHPYSPDDPDRFEYPVPTERNFRLYEHYRKRVLSVPKLTVCGRLGTFSYLDMDHAINSAFEVAKRLLNERSTHVSDMALTSGK